MLARTIAACTMIAGALLVGAGCSGTTSPPVTPPGNGNDTALVPMTINLQAAVGARPFAFDTVMTSEAGAQYRISLFRFYAALPLLVDTAGHEVPVTLLDSAGSPLAYGVQLVDYSKPASTSLHFLARRGAYTGFNFTIGVPPFGPGGIQLNHADASVLAPPLDVDADMYWGWKPGYIFLKLEGYSSVLKNWEQFYYHVGEDKRMMRITTAGPVNVRADSTGRAVLLVNVNRLFVTPSGGARPNIVGGLSDRVANSGAQTDTVAQNAVASGFITLKP